MSKRRTDGWAGIVDEDDLAEKTMVDVAPQHPDATPIDPLPSQHEAPSPVEPPRRPSRSAAPTPPLRLPVPSGSLSLPPPPSRSRPERPAEVRPASSSFSSEAFADRIAGPLGDAAPAPAVSKWREYREVIVTAAVGLSLLGGAVAWQVMKPPEPEITEAPRGPVRAGQRVRPISPAPKVEAPAAVPEVPVADAVPGLPAPPPPADPAAAAPVEPGVGAVAEPVAPVEPEPTRTKAATPMLTIITMPSDADLEIGDQFVGRSPLITTAPAGTQVLSLRVSKAGYATVTQELYPNEGGHFSASVQLEKTAP